ncbi:MAG: acyl-CoA dehydrogenase family protein, partial [Betaproteobacteria bacterium]|nr:acyl-CoA dehydrogenase family protein [Betaproteobacteria bacterium]
MIPQPPQPSDEDRQLLRDNVRKLLDRRWPAEKAPALSAEPSEVSALWARLAALGVAALGTDAAEGGLREILIVAEELGRASCPAPMPAAALANIALWPRRAVAAEAASLLRDLHQGRAALAIGLGAFDGDPHAGRLRIANGALSGALAFVEGTAGATHLLVLAEPGPVAAIVHCGAAGMKVVSTPGHAVPALAQVHFENAQATAVEISLELAEDLGRIARLAMIARALGAANRAFGLAVDYAKVRHQFGQPIGRFQAIQHKLADCLISLEGARLAL